MRTVIQSLSIHPKLINFVINILHKLISKQVIYFKKTGKVKLRIRIKQDQQELIIFIQKFTNIKTFKSRRFHAST